MQPARMISEDMYGKYHAPKSLSRCVVSLRIEHGMHGPIQNKLVNHLYLAYCTRKLIVAQHLSIGILVNVSFRTILCNP
jgi:hypothetical protein